MKEKINTIEEYIDSIPEEHKEYFERLRETIKQNLPKGYEEVFIYGMPSYAVPHSLYPKGYHCSPEIPLPFISIASQKSHIAIYHSGIYADQGLSLWFAQEYAKVSKTKLDMGKSCIRFKNPKNIPYDLIAGLAGKISPEMWIEIYENQLRATKK